jgi:hypothetical protein
MGKNFQVVSAFCVILVHVNNAEVGNLSPKGFHPTITSATADLTL